MKKFVVFTLVMALAAAMLTGCGCMNTKADVPTLPTNGEASKPTQATQAPTTEAPTVATTLPTTVPTESTADTTGPVEGAMDDILGTESTMDATVPGRSVGPRITGR